MSISSSKKRTARVTITEPRGSFTAEIRTLGQLDQQLMQRSMTCVMAGMQVMAQRRAAVPAEVAADAPERLRAMAEALGEQAKFGPEVIRVAAFGLVATEGLTEADESGEQVELRVPDNFDERYAFINQYFEFSWTLDVAIATFHHNSLTGADRGN